jgi:hypothetical protein
MNDDREGRVTAALGALAARDAGREAPARVEAALLEAFDRRQQARRQARFLWFCAAAAAVVLVAVGAGLLSRTQRPIEPPRAVVVTPAVPRIETAQAKAPAPRAVRRVRRPPPRPEVVTAYIPLVYESGALEDGPSPVLRMRLPRAVLVSFGLPMSPDPAADTVDADVVLDNAGMARAIRFVR